MNTRSRIGRIKARTELGTVIHGDTITLRWQEFASGYDTDELTGQKVGTVINKSATIHGQIHYVNPATTGYRVYQELEIGDAILDLPAEVSVDGKEGLVFEFGSEQWIQKSVGQKLAKSWAVTVQGVRLHRTVLVTRRS